MRPAPATLLLALALAASACTADDPVRDVARAAEPRALIARLTILLGPAACLAEPRDTIPCVATHARLTSPELRAARRAEQQLRERPDAATWHAAGLADLLWGDTAGKALDRSISRLQTAARLAERPAPALADLAAAYLARAERSRDSRDLLEAMEAASRALELSPGDPVAGTNLALGLERLGASWRAAHAWESVAAADSAPEWRTLASRHRAALSGRLVPGDSALVARTLPVADAALVALADTMPQEARAQGWVTLLRAWGESTLAGDTAAAARSLARAERVGTALEARRGDCTLLHAVQAIRAHAADRDATRRLARAHAAFARGHLLVDSLAHARATPELRAALAERAPSSTLNAWATLFSAIASVYAHGAAGAEPALREVMEAADTVSHPALAARARWAHGVVLMRLLRVDEGTADLRAAERLYDRAGEREYLGLVRSHLAEALLMHGRPAEGWSMLNRALLTLRDFPWTRARYTGLFYAVHFGTRDGYLRAARLVQEELHAVARRRGGIERLEAMLTGARLDAERGDAPIALTALDSVQALVAQLPEGDTRDWFAANAALTRATATLDTDPAVAAATLDSAERFFGSVSVNVPRQLAAVLGRAQAALRLGDEATAERRLGYALDELHARRDSIGDPGARANLLETARATTEAMIVRRAATDPARALEWLERGRASLVTHGRIRANATRRAPAGTVVVDYATIGDTLFAWTVSDTVHLARVPVPRAELARTIERARSSMEMGFTDAALAADLAALYRWLVQPVASRLGPEGTRLVIVADGAIGNVPFAALLDSARGEYLVERHPLRFATSLADATLPPPARARAVDALVLVGEPALAPGTSEAGVVLPPLRGATEEVRAIAALASDPARVALLTGAQATPSTLLDAFARAGTLHYAGHAVLDDERAERSWLALARDESGSARLTAAELAKLDLSRLELVVLSACQTLRARDGRSGGLAGFAEALLSAGAGGVVGSLWRVEDAATRELMVEFHRERMRRGDVAEALRAVQVQWIRSPDARRRSPAAWGAFRYAGR